ncbi:MAG: integration host factor, actinobacterial type [Acidimicrobiia bacterium]|nr:integration host factor, actinobacterial type [Acidimicrobiia bacterium]MDX2466882.1 integration host factor, actinobacterial type [Acidimicrobiia bacterium]
MPLPKMTDEQRAAALQRAGEARRVRAELKQLLKTGSLSLADVFDRADENELVGGIKVSAVVVSMPHMGKIKAKRLLEDLGIAENRRLRGLGSRQKQALLESF